MSMVPVMNNRMVIVVTVVMVVVLVVLVVLVVIVVCMRMMLRIARTMLRVMIHDFPVICAVVVPCMVVRSVAVRSVVLGRVVVRSVMVGRVVVGCDVMCDVVNCRCVAVVASTEIETVRHLTADLSL